jgi:hypothetical protein
MSKTGRGQERIKNPHTGNAMRSFSLLLCLGTLAGILIWAKLRLVTDIPRSAYADPREQQIHDETGDQLDDHALKHTEDELGDDVPHEVRP